MSYTPLYVARSNALQADQLIAKVLRAALFGDDPRPVNPRWIVPHVLRVTALQIRDPVAILVLMKADYSTFHVPRLLAADHDFLDRRIVVIVHHANRNGVLSGSQRGQCEIVIERQ